MPIYRGTYYTRTFAFTHEGGAPVDITGWQFRSHWRGAREDPNPPLLELNSANGSFTIADGPRGLLQMQIQDEETELLTPAKGSKVYFDVLRIGLPQGDVWLFEGNVPVKDPITHD